MLCGGAFLQLTWALKQNRYCARIHRSAWSGRDADIQKLAGNCAKVSRARVRRICGTKTRSRIVPLIYPRVSSPPLQPVVAWSASRTLMEMNVKKATMSAVAGALLKPCANVLTGMQWCTRQGRAFGGVCDRANAVQSASIRAFRTRVHALCA